MIIVPPSNATIETIIEFAGLTYDGYSLIAAEPEHLERLLHPLFDDIRTTLTVPAWIGLDLARALLFYAQRLHYWSGGVDSDEPLRALVAHIGRISGGRVEHRGAASLQQERSPVAGSATHGEFTDSWEYSHDEVYRWWYQRRWSSGPTLCFVGLNPSTGDTEGKPRPTLRKVVGWAKREGCGAVVVVNLFGYRATQPDALFTAGVDIVGDCNDETIARLSRDAAITLAAWGADKRASARAGDVIDLLSAPQCVGTTKSGAPRHPLYVRSSEVLQPFVGHSSAAT